YAECAARIVRELDRLSLEPQQIRAPRASKSEPAPSIVINGIGSGRRTLYFHGHYDVVPAFSPHQFQPVTRRGSVLGRGSSDMKSGLAAMIYTAHALRMLGTPLDGRVELVIVPNEETDGRRGSQVLAARRLLARDAIGMLTAEPTNGMVWNACR